METTFTAEPISRKELSDLAFKIRAIVNRHQGLFFDVVYFMENELHDIVSDFSYEICSKQEMGNLHGRTCPETDTIYIREDVYEGACDGHGRDRMTIAHEIGHLFLHANGRVSHARLEPGEKMLPYRDPEWQAKAFAGELLVPAYLIDDMTPFEIAKECGVSMQAATIQCNKKRNL